MTKADIIEKMQANAILSKKESVELLEAVLSIMKNTLDSGDTLKITGFGSFIVKQKADRRGRNPQTGEAMTITGRRVVTFKCSNVLRNALNGIAEPSI